MAFLSFLQSSFPFFSTLRLSLGGSKQTPLTYFSFSFQVLIFLFSHPDSKSSVRGHPSSHLCSLVSETCVLGLLHHFVLLLSTKTQLLLAVEDIRGL